MAYEMNAKRIALISSSRSTVQTLLQEATALGIRVPDLLELENYKKSAEMPQKVEKFRDNTYNVLELRMFLENCKYFSLGGCDLKEEKRNNFLRKEKSVKWEARCRLSP